MFCWMVTNCLNYRLGKIFNVTILSAYFHINIFRLYCRAIKIREFDAFLWYELGLSYYLRAIKYGNETNRKHFLELAADTAKHTIKMSPSRWKNWNLLGVICTTKGKFKNCNY